jgi:1-phosphatidylinositol-3-phosphate 5-kinase
MQKSHLRSIFRPTVLCKIVGVYQIGSHNLETGKRNMDQVAVMQNMFYKKKISMIFDLKGSLRGRYAAPKEATDDADEFDTDYNEDNKSGAKHGDMNDDNSLLQDTVYKSISTKAGPSTLLDGDFLDFTSGRPMPLTDRAKAVFQMSILVRSTTCVLPSLSHIFHRQNVRFI